MRRPDDQNRICALLGPANRNNLRVNRNCALIGSNQYTLNSHFQPDRNCPAECLCNRLSTGPSANPGIPGNRTFHTGQRMRPGHNDDTVRPEFICRIRIKLPDARFGKSDRMRHHNQPQSGTPHLFMEKPSGIPAGTRNNNTGKTEFLRPLNREISTVRSILRAGPREIGYAFCNVGHTNTYQLNRHKYVFAGTAK